MSEPEAQVRFLHAMAVELGAMAQNGLEYSSDPHDIQRYERIRELTADLLGLLSGSPSKLFRNSLSAENGHATPKVDVRGALFDANDSVLLIREASDGRWALPGGWADALDSPSQAIEREFEEEAGMTVEAYRIAFVHDGSVQNAHGESPWHIYKLFFLLRTTGPSGDTAVPVAGLDGETTDVGYFAIDSLPPLSTGRTTCAQLELLLAHHRNPDLPTDFD